MGFAGPIGAGKTTGARYLSEKSGFGYVRYSQVLADWAGAEAGDAASSLQAFGWDIMSRGGQEELNRRVLARIDSGRDFAVDGLRHEVDVASMRQAFNGAFFLLYVDAPANLRWQRKRKSERFQAYETFLESENHPVEQPLRLLQMQAVATIENTSSLEDYCATISAIVQESRRRITGGAS